MNSTARPRNPFFPVVTLFGGAFIVTIFAFIAALLGDPGAPMAKLLERYGGTIIVVEVAGVVVSGLCAMALDRFQSARTAGAERGSSEPVTSAEDRRIDQ